MNVGHGVGGAAVTLISAETTSALSGGPDVYTLYAAIIAGVVAIVTSVFGGVLRETVTRWVHRRRGETEKQPDDGNRDRLSDRMFTRIEQLEKENDELRDEVNRLRGREHA